MLWVKFKYLKDKKSDCCVKLAKELFSFQRSLLLLVPVPTLENNRERPPVSKSVFSHYITFYKDLKTYTAIEFIPSISCLVCNIDHWSMMNINILTFTSVNHLIDWRQRGGEMLSLTNILRLHIARNHILMIIWLRSLFHLTVSPWDWTIGN